MSYESVTARESAVMPGVRFTIAKISFGRRLELLRRIRELAARAEFLRAGEQPQEKMDAALLRLEIDRIYLRWGLQEVAGLELDGVPATPEALAEKGPEDLFQEALQAVKAECGLSAEETKN